MSENSNNKLVHSSKLGLVQGSVFENESENGKFLTITVSRAYLKKDGKPENKDDWKYTTSMRVNDVHSAVLVLEDCYKFAKTKKQE